MKPLKNVSLTPTPKSPNSTQTDWHTALAQALAYKKFKASRAPPDPYTPVTKERKDEQASKAYLAWKEECIVKARREVLSKAKKARVKTTKKSAKASGTLTNPNSEQLSEVSAVVGTIVTEVVGRMSVVPVAGGMSESEKFLQQVKNGGLSPVQPEFKDEEPASLASPALKDEFADVTDNATLDDSVVVESQKMLKSILLDEMIPVAKKETAAPSKVEKGFAWPEVLSDEKTLGDYSALSDDAQTVFDGVVSSNEIMVRVVTWNQQAKTPPSTALLRDALFAVGKFHLLVIGTEECENTIAGSIVNTSKKKWEEAVKIACGESYVKVRGHTLQATNNMVMVHVGVRQLVTEVGSGVVATGLSNPVAASQQLGNKGGVGIGLKIGDTSFCFVNAHLAAHQKEVERRNGEFEKIGRELGGMLGGEGTVLQTFDNVFFGGDMNYRINGTRQVVDKLLEKDMYDHLVKNDQLALAMFSNDCFDGFVEGPLHFKPTYKVSRWLRATTNTLTHFCLLTHFCSSTRTATSTTRARSSGSRAGRTECFTSRVTA